MKTLIALLMLAFGTFANAVTYVAVSDVTTDTATLTWDADGSDSYTVWRKQTGTYGQIFIPYATTVDTLFAVTKSNGFPWLDTYKIQGIGGSSPEIGIAFLAVPAGSLVLDPGPGYPTYIDHSCGGVKRSEKAFGFSEAGNLLTEARFATQCSTGGRGARVRQFATLWAIEYTLDGQVVDAVQVASCTRLYGGLPMTACDSVADTNLSYANELGVFATASIVAAWRAYWLAY